MISGFPFFNALRFTDRSKLFVERSLLHYHQYLNLATSQTDGFLLWTLSFSQARAWLLKARVFSEDDPEVRRDSTVYITSVLGDDIFDKQFCRYSDWLRLRTMVAFRYLAAFANASSSKLRDVEKRRQISHFLTLVKIRGWVGEIFIPIVEAFTYDRTSETQCESKSSPPPKKNKKKQKQKQTFCDIFTCSEPMLTEYCRGCCPEIFLCLHQFWSIYLNICMNCIIFTSKTLEF